jgi:hypothetical protein
MHPENARRLGWIAAEGRWMTELEWRAARCAWGGWVARQRRRPLSAGIGWRFAVILNQTGWRRTT